MHGGQLIPGLELLADRWLTDAESFSDLPLGHTSCDHRSQRKYASQSGDILPATSIEILGHQRHKDILSRQRSRRRDAQTYDALVICSQKFG